MKRFGVAIALLLVLSNSLARIPAAAAAGSFATRAPSRAATAPGAQQDSNLGVGAAIGCGLGVRYWPVVVIEPALLSVWIGLCLVMVIDALATPDGN
jgi:hypothetical protein